MLQWRRQEFVMGGLGSQGKFHFPKWHFSVWLLPPKCSFHSPKYLMTVFSHRLKFVSTTLLFFSCYSFIFFIKWLFSGLFLHCIKMSMPQPPCLRHWDAYVKRGKKLGRLEHRSSINPCVTEMHHRNHVGFSLIIVSSVVKVWGNSSIRRIGDR